MAKLELRLLGELEVLRDGEPLPLPQSKKTRALLAYLALTGRAHRRERLCDLFWDVTDDPRAALRWSLSKLRTVLGAQCIVADRKEAGVDLGCFDVDLSAASALGAQLERDPGSVEGAALSAVLERFRGEPLAGLDLPDFDAFQAFLLAEREEALQLRGRLLREQLARLAGDAEAALPHARALVKVDPYDEAARVQLLKLLRALGREREAQQQLAAAERALSEAGISPGAALREAARAPVAGGGPAAAGRPSPPPEAAPPAPAFNPPPSPIQRSTVHGHRLVGREAEREQLGAFMDRVRDERGARVLLVQGEAGIGKTRMLLEALIQGRSRRGLVLEGAANEAEPSRPFGPWVDALRRALPATLGSSAAALAPFTSGAQQVDRPLAQTLADVVRERLQQAPLMLIALDDLQWFPGPSCDVLHALVRACADLPLALVVTVREAELPDNLAAVRMLRSLRRERVVDSLQLGPLDADATAELIMMVRPGMDRQRVYADCAGNPLFALEIARSGPPQEGVAPSLSTVVGDRLERLPPAGMEVLRWAAVLGPTFRVQLLERVVGLPAGDLLSTLEALERHGLIGGLIDLQQPGGSYEFAHQLVRQVVYGELSVPRRRLMHARVAAALSDTGDDDAADRAHHAMQSGDAAAAVDACSAAARRCLELLVPGQAELLARRALHYADRLPEAERAARQAELTALAEQARGAAAGA